ncbi:MAG: YjdF family protein [Lachnospiraceae bacterium]|nr:YjdF family protein [Lachnospiraceae bacterium]MCI8960551.1 YjdF family protein [Lachnospiraceae bacterium]
MDGTAVGVAALQIRKFNPICVLFFVEDGGIHKQHKHTSLQIVETRTFLWYYIQQEQLKTQHKSVSRERREAEKQRQFERKQQKRKEKQKGQVTNLRS